MRGEVVLVLFPDSNLQTFKRRPALVIQADGLNTGLRQTVVAMITSNLTRGGHPSRVVINRPSPASRQMGLQTLSGIMTDNLATVLESAIDRVIGHCPSMTEVEAALRHTLEI